MFMADICEPAQKIRSISSPNCTLPTNPGSPLVFSRGGKAKATESDELDLDECDTPTKAATHYMRPSNDRQLDNMVGAKYSQMNANSDKL